MILSPSIEGFTNGDKMHDSRHEPATNLSLAAQFYFVLSFWGHGERHTRLSKSERLASKSVCGARANVE